MRKPVYYRWQEYPIEDLLEMLFLRSGEMSVLEFIRLPKATKRKWAGIFYGVRELPERFITSEVKQTIQDVGVHDYQRFLLMLFQGGYLVREVEPRTGRIVYVKTELSKSLTDEQLAFDIISKDKVMIGYPKQKARKASRRSSDRDLIAMVFDEEFLSHPYVKSMGEMGRAFVAHQTQAMSGRLKRGRE